ncbi:uncharacterized protein LOC120346499 [Styela clava]
MESMKTKMNCKKNWPEDSAVYQQYEKTRKLEFQYKKDHKSGRPFEMRPKTSNVLLRQDSYAQHKLTRAKSAGETGKVRRRFVFKSRPDSDSRNNEYVLIRKNSSENHEEKDSEFSSDDDDTRLNMMGLNIEAELSFVLNLGDDVQKEHGLQQIRVPTPWERVEVSPLPRSNSIARNCDVTSECMTFTESVRLSEVKTPSCCQGPNNGALVNNKDNVENWYYDDVGIVREKTMLIGTIRSPVPSKRIKKLETTEGVGNKTEQDTVSSCNYANLSREQFALQKINEDNYSEGCSSDETDDLLAVSDRKLSYQDFSSEYPSSSFSTDSLNSGEESAGYTEIFVLSDNLEPIFPCITKDPVQLTENLVENVTAEPMPELMTEVEHNTRHEPVLSGPSQCIRNSTETIKENGFIETNFDTIPKENGNCVDVVISDRVNPSYYPPDCSTLSGREENAMSRTPDSSAMLQIPPPSALKKRSLSRSGSGKKHKVQFDMDIEVHFVPRDQYDPTTTSVISEFSDYSGFEGSEKDEDLFSEYSNEVDDDFITSQDSSGDMEFTTKTRQLQGPSVPFRLIRRDIPTGSGSRRDRRDSFDLKQVQKLMTQQARGRAYMNQKLGVTDHERRYVRPPHHRRIPSPPRTPHSSYYPSREYRRQFDDPRTQMRANTMSPEQYVAFYTRQQQLKQYLDHERRIRRQQLLSGNMKYNEAQMKQERLMQQNIGRNEEESESDSGTEDYRHFPKVQTLDTDRLPQPKPHVRGASSHGHRMAPGSDEVSRISSGYGGSVTESEPSSMTLKNDLKMKDDIISSSLPIMMLNKPGTASQQPFTPRQVAEVMRSSGINKGSMRFYSKRNGRRHHREEDAKYATTSRQIQRRAESSRDSNTSGGSEAFSKLSLNARKALQQAHMAYTSSINDMMPAAKPFSDSLRERSEDVDSLDSRLAADLGPTLSQEPKVFLEKYLNEGSQPFVRYLHSNTRGKIPEIFTRQQSHVRDSLSSGRLGSGRLASSVLNLSTSDNSRPGTTESVTTVNMLGLSARLPLNSRRKSVHGQRTQEQKQEKSAHKQMGEPYRRLTSGNKSPYLKSQLPDEFLTRNIQHSLSNSTTDSSRPRSIHNHNSANSRRRHLRRQDSDLYRSGPPQLRGNHYTYTPQAGTQSATHSKGAVVPKISV